MSDTITTPSPVYLEWLTGGVQPSCDFYVDGKVLCQGEAAEWVMYRNPCCARTMVPALACTVCKDARVNDMISLECESCGRLWEHAPEAYDHIERIDKR
ncbi:MAG TPA: hypothetical protein VFH56_12500 [Acidimicrobiales bacterium]|nr:hypothetical protein [Acidimicrobiales bacterium]